jgi:phage regulator Rha-like protein
MAMQTDLTAVPMTMSSLEIAGLCCKRHDNVLRDADKMLMELGISAGLSFEASYVDASGRSLRCFNLPKRESLILVSGYSVEMRARIIDRWIELEAIAARAPE